MLMEPVLSPEQQSSSSSRGLDFIYIGTPKAGSTWLFEALREHPDARLLASKSSTHFETDNPGPIGDYRKLLTRLDPGGKAGEIAHDAYIYGGTAQRLRDAFPQVKVLACLREPGDFARSMLSWLATHTNLYGSNVAEITAHPHYHAVMDYVGKLAPFYELFAREQVKVVFFDDFAADAVGFYREICAFLGLSSEFRPEVLERVVNPARPPRVAALTHSIFRAGRIERAIGLGGLVEGAKRSKLMEGVLYAQPSSEVDPAIHEAAARTRAAARPRLDELEALIGRPVPPAWRGE